MLKDKLVLTIVSKDFDDLELWYPILRLREAGATVLVAGEIANHEYVGKYGLTVKSDLAFDKVEITNFDALLIPGGWAPDRKSTRLNSSHVRISYAVFCLKKKK